MVGVTWRSNINCQSICFQYGLVREKQIFSQILSESTTKSNCLLFLKMGLTICRKADYTLLGLLVLVVVFVSLDGLSETGAPNAVHVRNRRRTRPSSVCLSQWLRCELRARVVTPKPTCKFTGICEPQSTTTGTPQNTTDVNGTDSFVNTSTPVNSVTSMTLSVDSDSNSTSTARATTPHWKNDTSKCSFNFQCVNGGTCVGKPRFPECACTPGWNGQFCQEPCSLKCENNGTCMYLNNTQHCVCKREYEGRKCESLKPPEASNRVFVHATTEHPWFSYVIAFFALMVGVLLGYILLRRLRGRSLLVTKMFYFFQPYEDDDGKEFDAFISFKSSNSDFSQSEDEKFVVRTLHPKLEKEMHFRLCVHYRDFLPGDTIANNIMYAVENSRRTILILSPNYLQSEWGRLEYQKAQQEMLKLNHKIIPVIIEDISKTTIEDPNLSHILASVTYIEYPGTSDEKLESKFWQMLQLALPKKRSSESQSESESTTSSFTSPSSQALVSQESWQSARTDITEMSEDSIEMKDVSVIDPDVSVISPYSHHINMDIKEKVSSSNYTGSEKNEIEKTLSENANKFICILEEGT